VQFDENFKIWLTRETKITLNEAIKLAKDNLIGYFVYDPMGKYNSSSWWWCVSVLEVLQQEDLIREFEIVKGPPENQSIEAKAGVVY
jgi:hypothetical protein